MRMKKTEMTMTGMTNGRKLMISVFASPFLFIEATLSHKHRRDVPSLPITRMRQLRKDEERRGQGKLITAGGRRIGKWTVEEARTRTLVIVEWS